MQKEEMNFAQFMECFQDEASLKLELAKGDVFYIEPEYVSQIQKNLRRWNKLCSKRPKEISGMARNIRSLSYSDIDGAVDINDFIKCFPSLKLENGYILDYVYAGDGYGGEPFVYARKITENSVKNIDEFCKQFNGGNSIGMLLGAEATPALVNPYIHHIKYEQNAQSIYELGLFCMLVRRFYLFWHSLYNERTYITNKMTLDSVCRKDECGFNDEDYANLRKQNYRPKVVIGNKVQSVTFLTQERNRGVSFLNIYFGNNLFLGLSENIVIKSRSRIFY